MNLSDEETKALFRKTMPVARRVVGERHDLTRKMKIHYAMVLYLDPDATLDDLREAVATLEDTERISGACSVAHTPMTGEVGSKCATRKRPPAPAKRRVKTTNSPIPAPRPHCSRPQRATATKETGPRRSAPGTTTRRRARRGS